jgi:hypothetical protein
MFRMTDLSADREPSRRELAEIEAEWPLIAADLAELEAEIVALSGPSELDARRARRRGRRVLRSAAAAVLPLGGEAA